MVNHSTDIWNKRVFANKTRRNYMSACFYHSFMRGNKILLKFKCMDWKPDKNNKHYPTKLPLHFGNIWTVTISGTRLWPRQQSFCFTDFHFLHSVSCRLFCYDRTTKFQAKRLGIYGWVELTRAAAPSQRDSVVGSGLVKVKPLPIIHVLQHLYTHPIAQSTFMWRWRLLLKRWWR